MSAANAMMNAMDDFMFASSCREVLARVRYDGRYAL
jgi:hypothetical protein